MAVFKPEKLKFNPSTFGLVNLKALGFPSFARLSISGPAGYPKPSNFPLLSNASPTASSIVSPITVISK